MTRLSTNPEQNMVGRREEFNTFQFNSTKSDPEIPAFFFFLRFYIFIFRERGREGKERKRNISVWKKHQSVAFCICPNRWPAHNPGKRACDLTGNWTSDLFCSVAWHPTNWATPLRYRDFCLKGVDFCLIAQNQCIIIHWVWWLLRGNTQPGLPGTVLVFTLYPSVVVAQRSVPVCKGLIPSQGTRLGCRPGPQEGALKRQPHIDVPHPSFLLPFPSLKINK